MNKKGLSLAVSVIGLCFFTVTASADCVDDGEGNITCNVAGEEDFLEFSGPITGQRLVKEGHGMLQLSGDPWGGALTVNDGGVDSSASVFTGSAYLNDEESFLSFTEETDNIFGGSISGIGSFINEGAGVLMLSPNAQISARAEIEAGGISISSSTSLSGEIIINGGALFVTDDVTLNNLLYFGEENAGVSVSAGKTLTLGADAKIEAFGADVIKVGAGTLAIDPAASGRYFADTYIKEGVLQISSGEALGAEGYAVKIADAVLSVMDSAVIDNGIQLLTASSEVSTAAGAVTLTAGTEGAGVLNKTGAGTIIIDGGVLNHLGGTVIHEGALQGGTEHILGGVQINSGAALNLIHNEDGLWNAVLSGAGRVNKTGAGTLVIEQKHDAFLGLFNVQEGAVSASSAEMFDDIFLSAGAGVIFNQSACDGAACEYAGLLSGAGSLTKTGPGLLVLTQPNTYSGGTYLINDTRDSLGILFRSDSALGGGDIFMQYANLTLDTGQNVSTSKNFTFSGLENSITVLDGSVYTVNGVLSGASFTKLGEGELILTAQNTHSGGTQITQGTLSTGNAHALGSGILSVTGGVFKPLDNMEIDNNIYLSAAPGQGGFLVEDGLTLKLNGIVSGGGTLNKTGKGVLELGYYNSHSGGVHVSEGLVRGDTDSILGNLTLLAGAEAEFNQNFDGEFYGDIHSEGVIIKNGFGTLTARANAYEDNVLSVGSLLLNEGAFIAKSRFEGDAFVASGAALMLEDHATGVFETHGSLFISNAKDIDVYGEITVKSGGELAVFMEEGKSSMLRVKDAGHITIEDGGKINIIAEGGFSSPGLFDFLSYEGSLNITGALSDIEVSVGNNRRLKAEIIGSSSLFSLYSAEPEVLSVLITRILSEYSSLPGLTRNELKVASALDALSAAPEADMENILNAMDDLPSAARASALAQLGGFIYANQPNYFDNFRDNAYLRMSRPAEEESFFLRNLWVQSVNNYSDIKVNDYSREIYNFSSGFTVGLDSYFEGSGAVVGLFAGYARHDLKHNNTENLDGDEYMGGIYALKQGSLFDFKAALSAGYNINETERNISFAGRTAASKITAHSYNADLETGFKLYKGSSFSVRTFVGATGAINKMSSFLEDGGGSANLSSEGAELFTVRARGGLGLEKSGKSFSYYADVLLKQQLNNPEYSLIIDGMEYKIKGADKGTLLGINIGGVKHFSGSASLFADAGADLNSAVNNFYFNIGLRTYW